MTAKSLRHKFVSAIADGPTSSVVRPSNWNDDHDFLLGLNAQTGISYTIADTDNLSFISFSNAASVAVTLPQAGSGGGTLFKAGWAVWVRNEGAGTVTITPTTSTISGASAINLPPGAGGMLVSNGTNYHINFSRLVLITDIADATAIGKSLLSAIDAAALRTITGSQPLDSDLTTIAGLTATTDNFLQAKSSAWASRTLAQVGVDLFSATAFGPIGQLPFPATQIPSAGANVLDDYEEGTWTPRIIWDNNANPAHTYTSQVGVYVKIGQLVFLSFSVGLSAVASAAGATFALVGNFPFAASGTATRQGSMLIDVQNLVTARASIGIQIQANATGGFICYNTGGTGTVINLIPATDIAATTFFGGSTCYRAAA